MPNIPTMQVEVEPSASAAGKRNARCGPYEISSPTVSIRVRIGDAARLDAKAAKEQANVQ
jgi:hypothetical protein